MMKSTLTEQQIMEQSYKVGDEVMFAYCQASNRGYNRTATVTKVCPFDTYEVRDDHNEVSRTDASELAPLSSKM
jgi:ferredoxin-like protein FixX